MQRKNQKRNLLVKKRNLLFQRIQKRKNSKRPILIPEMKTEITRETLRPGIRTSLRLSSRNSLPGYRAGSRKKLIATTSAPSFELLL